MSEPGCIEGEVAALGGSAAKQAYSSSTSDKPAAMKL
jgi:hypothetical protein